MITFLLFSLAELLVHVRKHLFVATFHVKGIDVAFFIQLEISCRQEIVRRALRFCRQQGGGGGKKKKQEDSGKMSWDEAANQLQQRVAHLENVNSDTIRSFSQADKPKYQKYAEMYDKSCGNDKMVRLQELLMTAFSEK